MSPSLTFTFVCVLLLSLQTTAAKELSSDVQVSLRTFSDLWNGRHEQITQQPPLESDLYETLDEDEANRSPLSDEARMDLWRRRLELCRSWIDQMSARQQKSKPKLFARLSRGRLDRMPLSYGKRSSSEDPWTRADISNGGFARIGRERLNRMPLTFGKRQDIVRALNDLSSSLQEEFPNDLDNMAIDHSSEPKSEASDGQLGMESFTRAQRDRLDRMPLRYGKRLWTGSRDLASYSRSERGRLDRMPLTYGKRSGDAMSHGCKDRAELLDNFPRSLLEIDFADKNENTLETEGRSASSTSTPDVTSRWLNYEAEGVEYDGEVPLTRLPRSKLQRMPFSFGKRVGGTPPLQGDGHILPNDMLRSLKVEDLQNIERRSRMDRMPVNFGKRMMSDSALIKRLRLDRMPMAFGKRDVVRDSLLSSDLVEDIGEYSIPNYEGILISELAVKGDNRNLNTRTGDDDVVPSVQSKTPEAALR